MKEDYLKILYDNKIKYIYHFTNISNLESIIKYGICNRKYLGENNIEYSYTDKDRFDNQIDCISLSLNSINKNMFMFKSNRFDNDWIIFEFDAIDIISNFYNKIYYCKYNASSHSVINLLNSNKLYLKSVDAFKKIFENDKSYLQCELLLEGNISFNYVKSIYVDSLQNKLIVMDILNENNIIDVNVIVKREMF